ncbi:MFS transporter [Reticulibacter mediterranei]|uniref:MFS transporter n=2 Tax=Reticulibacter mediterranei TaxID=2778369 RepID=A0A8J3J544_9CHLR|nr:MFS transporter [Reticulibacter mediterranei]
MLDRLGLPVGNVDIHLASIQAKSLLILRLGAVLLAAIVISQNFTNYGSIVHDMAADLQTNEAGMGLLSLFLYAMIGVSYLLGGTLSDRFGPQRVLAHALLIVGLGNCLLGLYPTLSWVLLCRAVVGGAAGTAIVAASQTASRMGPQAPLWQGLFGGGMQLGAALGIFLTPRMEVVQKWENAFLLWGCLAILAGVSWSCLQFLPLPSLPSTQTRALLRRRVGILGTLGLVHLGTLGLGQALAPWLPTYFMRDQGMPMDQAILLGALTLLIGMMTRPLGGWLLAHGVASSQLILVGTALATSGLSMLVGSGRASLLWLAIIGLILFSIGTTLPYAGVFQQASYEGQITAWRPATAQGIVSLLSSPGSAGGPALIGILLSQGGGFALSFTCFTLISLVSLFIALFASSVLPAMPSLAASTLPPHVSRKERS